MSTTYDTKNAGWFCHAPNKARQPEEVALPPTSQIPGLNEFPEGYPPAEEPKKMYIKDTDTKYIKLCKMNGRSDLLRIPSPKPQEQQAKSYPTVDWFYLEDIRKEEAEKKQAEADHSSAQYQPLLPDYMVHRDYAPKGDRGDFQKGKNPLSRDDSTVFQREGSNAVDKTVKIQEARPSGYGIRGEKQKNKTVQMPQMPKYQRAKGRESELDADKPKVRQMKVPKEEERANMSKILSYGYQKDWRTEHDKWEKEQEDLMRMQHESVMHTTKQEKPVSEYQAQTRTNGRPDSHGRVPSHGRRAPSGGSSSSHRRMKAHHDTEPPAIFSLPKYDASPKPEISPMRYDPVKNLSSLGQEPADQYYSPPPPQEPEHQYTE